MFTPDLFLPETKPQIPTVVSRMEEPPTERHLNSFQHSYEATLALGIFSELHAAPTHFIKA